MDYGVILTVVLVLLQQETSDQHCGASITASATWYR
jgi:hypothetical protein